MPVQRPPQHSAQQPPQRAPLQAKEQNKPQQLLQPGPRRQNSTAAMQAISNERKQEASGTGDLDEKLARLQDMLRMAKQN